MKKLIKLLSATLLGISLAITLTACGNDDSVVRIGVTGAFNDHWAIIQELVAEEGITIELVSFSDFLTPNLALNDRNIDLNAFQNRAFLINDVAANNYQIEAIAETWIVPLNIFNNQSRISSLADIRDGHTIAIPSDPVNYARALRLLESAGLIRLNTPPGELASELHIVERIVNINIMPAESGMLASMLPDLEAAVINGGNAFTAGLNPAHDSIFTEDVFSGDSDGLVNLVVARSEDMANPERARIFNIIVDAFRSEEVRQFVLDEYQGAFLPVW